MTRPALLYAAAAVLALSLGTPRAPRAELSADDYGSGGDLRPAPDRPQAQAAIDAARRRAAEQEAARERARQAEEANRLAQEAEREARRPPGERLIARYCAPCHGPERIAAARHTRLGWSFTVARMRYFNQAEIPAAAAHTIAAHLALAQPAGLAWTLAEYGLAAALVLAPVGWMWLGRARRLAASRGGDKGALTTHDCQTEISPNE
ncbi:hypothetical protein [uncultured Thiodictyon sp.]|jgi:hypothetical protein|uniref:hypothetical protein n=1 Tax=uncultured Thiodictyon sp. TaxID=1846217 RepID=UPI0025CF70D5|nr:hypothetical protein [uncultured Thiodictyon sp.]